MKTVFPCIKKAIHKFAHSARNNICLTFKGQQAYSLAGILANTASHCFGSSEDKYAVFSHSV